MIAKIGRSSNLYGALAYNYLKVENKSGQILLMNNMIETKNGVFSVSQLAKSFDSHVIANRNTEKFVLHISLNPDPKDKLTNEDYKAIAQDYMLEMGYMDQPYIVFKHTDIERAHMHIVSVCIDGEGRKISDKFEKMRSMKACRTIENSYNLLPAVGRDEQKNEKIFNAVNHHKGNVKSQISSVVRHLPRYYKFQTLGEYNALLSLYNITAEKFEIRLKEEVKYGLQYWIVDDKGNKVHPSFKSSLFGKNAGLSALEKLFTTHAVFFKNQKLKDNLKSLITSVIKSTTRETDFIQSLKKNNVAVAIRRNNENKIYGITFIDHRSQSVWNGSRLGKEFSANTFNNLWQDQQIHKNNQYDTDQTPNLYSISNTISDEAPHPFFDFTDRIEKQNDSLIEALGNILTVTNHEDYEELDFANKMKKMRKKRRKH